MKRRLFNVLTIASVVVCAVAGYTLLTSSFRTDAVSACVAGRYWCAQTHDWSLLLVRVDSPAVVSKSLAWDAYGPGAVTVPPTAPGTGWQFITMPKDAAAGPSVRRFGEADSFMYLSCPNPPGAGGTQYVIQIWSLPSLAVGS